ncbi:hypothetical protein ONZ43_g5110 [Nemania bipapillata]|uniref:Uncharacterized protein n=1 Tax=Nemania bipapillata TaxID=110536 RepID=A0ACC2IET4_9PEZI|nr:hypothetical protein ONZ43_g5110 [Nemania bipapillata]
MRPSSFFGVLAVAAYSLPLPPFNDSLLDNLQDLIFKSVGGLFSYPFGLYGQPGFFGCNFDSKFCIAQCVPNCQGDSQSCSNCLVSCYRDSGCFGGSQAGNQEPDNKGNTPTTPPAPAPTPSSDPQDPANPDATQ